MAATAPPLVERDAELETLGRLLADARAGSGVAVFVEAPAGHGKTTLLRTLREQAAAQGFRVLQATGAELDRDFAFGLIRQLFEPTLRQAEGERRARLLDGPAELAESIFGSGEASGEAEADAAHMRRHALYWLAANLAEEAPLLICVDDAHWGDAPSLRAIDVIARRIADLPVLLAVGARPGEPGAEQDLLDGIASGPAAHVLRLAPLSPPAVGVLLQEALGREPEPAFVDACAHTSGGNPLMVRELVRTLAAEGYTGAAAEAAAARRAVPGTITRAVISRVRRLSPDALSLVRSVAILPDRARQDAVATLAGLEREAVGREHEVLVRVGLLDAQMHFVHPMVREAVLGDLIGGERVAWHRRAADVLRRGDAAPELVAPHLLQTEPEGEAWVAPLLLATGRRALADGAPEVAVRHLRRALAEPPSSPDEREQVELALGRAALAAGEPDALEHLTAASEARDPRVAAAAERARASLLIMGDRREELVEGLRRSIGRIEHDDPELVMELRDELLNAIQHDPRFRDERAALLGCAESEGHPALLAHLALERALTGAPAGEVLALARRALGDGELVRSRGAEGSTVHHLLEAIILAEARDEAAAVLTQASTDARRRGSRLAATYVAAARTHWERTFGDLRRAQDEAQRALDLFRAPGDETSTNPTGPALAAALLDRGEIEAAERLIERLQDDGDAPRGLYVRSAALRAQLRLAQGRADEAVMAAEHVVAVEDARGWVTSPRDDTRAVHATALAVAGRTQEALEAADRALEMARARGVHGAQATALLARARAQEGDDALATLEQAVAEAERSPRRFVQAQALGALGALLRRSGQRVACRDPLAQARELAHACGATGLESRIHEELIVAGARPKRVALSGVDALTAAERRVAELAAQGLRNRDIAAELFVTLKTVEVHLGSTYSKLNIRGRPQLAEALAGGTAGAAG